MVVIEKVLRAFRRLLAHDRAAGGARALVAVAAELGDGLLGRVRQGGTFALDDDERDAVHAEDEVGDDVALAAGRVNAELIDGQVVVALRAVEVNELHAARSPLVAFGRAFNVRASVNEPGRGLVSFYQLEAFEPL